MGHEANYKYLRLCYVLDWHYSSIIRRTARWQMKLISHTIYSFASPPPQPKTSYKYCTDIRIPSFEKSLKSFLFSHHNAFTSSRRLTGILRLFHFCDHQIESLGNIVTVPSTGLGEWALEFFGQFSSFFGLDLAMFTFEIAFVSHNGQRNPIDTLYLKRTLIISIYRFSLAIINGG